MAKDEFTFTEEEEPKDSTKEAADAKPAGAPEAPKGEKGKEGEEGAPEGVKGEEKKAEPKDPLEGLTLSELLKHPILGPLVHRWADKSASSQSAVAVDRAKIGWDEEAAVKALEEKFDAMSEEELGRALSNPETRDAFAALTERRNKSRDDASDEAIAVKGQRYGYAVEVGVYTEMLGKSDLPDEKKAELNPDNFTHLGPQGIVAWGAAVQQALVEHATDAKAKTLLEEKWDAFQEEKLGGGGEGSEQGRDGVDASSGAPRGPVTAGMLKKMTPQEVMQVPQELRDRALLDHANRQR